MSETVIATTEEVANLIMKKYNYMYNINNLLKEGFEVAYIGTCSIKKINENNVFETNIFNYDEIFISFNGEKKIIMIDKGNLCQTNLDLIDQLIVVTYKEFKFNKIFVGLDSKIKSINNQKNKIINDIHKMCGCTDIDDIYKLNLEDLLFLQKILKNKNIFLKFKKEYFLGESYKNKIIWDEDTSKIIKENGKFFSSYGRNFGEIYSYNTIEEAIKFIIATQFIYLRYRKDFLDYYF